MARHANETKANAFTFVMERIASINKSARDSQEEELRDDRSKKVVPCWDWLLPDINGNASKRSHFQTSKSPRELAIFVAEGDDPDRRKGLAQQLVGKPEERDDYFVQFEFTSLVGRLVRNSNGPLFEAVASGSIFDNSFGPSAIEKFVNLTSKDFPDKQQFLIEELRASLLYISQEINGAQGGVNNLPPYWPKDGRKTSYDAYLSSKTYVLGSHRYNPPKAEWRCDLLTAMIAASLLGPRDYRPELLIPLPDRTARTVQPGHSTEEARPSNATKIDIACQPYLTRVTFDQQPPDELDWIACEGKRAGDVKQQVSIPLQGKAEVILARGATRYDDSGKIVTVRLDCPASSKEHARITYDEATGQWILRDMDSTNGTLVVSRDGSRKLLHVDQESRDNDVPLQNGDVICIAPDWVGGHAIPTHPAFVFQLSTSDWN